MCTIRFIVVKGYLSNHSGCARTLSIQGATFYFINICHFSLNNHNNNKRNNNNKRLTLVFADYNSVYNDNQILNGGNEENYVKIGSYVLCTMTIEKLYTRFTNNINRKYIENSGVVLKDIRRVVQHDLRKSG